MTNAPPTDAETRPELGTPAAVGFPPGTGLAPADAVTATLWPELQPGVPVTIIKLAPEGHEVTRYPGEITRHDAATGWVVARAVWTDRAVDVDGVIFRPADPIDESFSPTAWFNAFTVWHGDQPGGSYLNVTFPTRLERTREGLALIWHDLYLDLIVRPDQSCVMRDEDELADSGLAHHHPALHRQIERTAGELYQRLTQGSPLFT